METKNYIMATLLYYAGQILTAKGLKIVLSWIVFGITWITGGIDQIWLAFFTLLCLDFFLGFVRAWKKNKISQRKLKDGIGKFIFYGIAIVAGNLMDIVFFHKSGVTIGFRNFFAVYFSLNEMLSVCKHLIFFGVKIPNRVIDKLENYRDDLNFVSDTAEAKE